MNLLKKISASRLWTTLQFVALTAALLIPLFTKESMTSREQAAVPLDPSAHTPQSNLTKIPRKPVPKSSSQLSSKVLTLPDPHSHQKAVLVSKSRQIRFEKVTLGQGREIASLGKSKIQTYKLVKVRRKNNQGEFEDIPLVMNGVGQRQPIGTVYVELFETETVFLADYMDPTGKLFSQEIHVKQK